MATIFCFASQQTQSLVASVLQLINTLPSTPHHCLPSVPHDPIRECLGNYLTHSLPMLLIRDQCKAVLAKRPTTVPHDPIGKISYRIVPEDQSRVGGEEDGGAALEAFQGTHA